MSGFGAYRMLLVVSFIHFVVSSLSQLNRSWAWLTTAPMPQSLSVFGCVVKSKFALSLAVSKNDMMRQMVDKPKITPVGQDRDTLTFKALLDLNVAVDAQVCGLFCVVYMPIAVADPEKKGGGVARAPRLDPSLHYSAWLPCYNEYLCCQPDNSL